MIIDTEQEGNSKIILKVKTIDSNEYIVELSQEANIEELKKLIEDVYIFH